MGVDAIVIVGAVAGIGVTAILFLAGYLTSGAASSTLTISPGGAGPDATCGTLCSVWNGWRALACTAVAASAAAGAALAAANAALASASVTAALLLAAAIAASLIPFLGPAIAGPIIAAYVVAQALVVFLLGRQVAAAQAATSAANDATTALAGAAAARADLVARCTDPTALAQCLAIPSPCSSVP